MPNRNIVKEIRKATKRKFSAEDKIRIVFEGLRVEIQVSTSIVLMRVMLLLWGRCCI